MLFASCADVNNQTPMKKMIPNFAGRDGATTTSAEYKSFPSDAVMAHGDDAKYRVERLGSIPYDEMRQDAASVPGLAPISPCFSEDSSVVTATPSITGKLTDIERTYRVDPRILGTGHHGSVRMCVERSTGRKLAVKSIRKSDPVVDQLALVREIDFLTELRHQQHVVQLVDTQEDEEYLHIVTDLCEGRELYDRIVERSNEDNGVPCFREDEAAEVVRQILTGITYLHRCGVVHRDIKPENILFESKDEDSSIKIVDFGLATKHDAGSPPLRQVVGTPYYIAPEVLRQKYDRSCDLWSVGVISYILLCGYPPFNGADNREVYQSLRRGRYCFPAQDWCGISREARDFVRKLLHRDPRRRMTAEEALRHPWIAGRVTGREHDASPPAPSSPVCVADRDDEDWSIEVVFGGMAEDDSVLCEDGADRRAMRDAPLIPDLS